MNWCPVEWPTKPRPTLANIEAKQSGKKATMAGLLGLSVLVLMASVVLGYALWSQSITVSEIINETEGFIHEVVTGKLPVTLQVDGKTTVLQTTSKTVQGLLEEQRIGLKPEDKVFPALSAPIKKNIKVQVIRVEVKKEYHNLPVPFTTERMASQEMPRGFARKVRNGKEGLQKEVWSVRYEDGVEVSRICEAREIIQQPVNALVQYGTLSNVNRGGENLRINRAMEMLATGYSYTGYNTATGVVPRPGIAAVDPRVIPLGTRLYVEGYGKATALDTGGAIQGGRIDLFYETEAEALQWGKRNTRVYVLE
ncbi:3D domain protein [Desulforamulus reducens MI-1]|uniref:3D domain protein n=1 Tax=Desulforamulus reducens (strain ATCC BAA-1160 / DSM 100696 / MI-1) TaxID=349161 RepID=A4J0L7_DESRM|nr:3D domain-containing protein [Desulforamulus reducens]ABO48620.1 3D domain protein [Desulforamulus reducens MI-1]